MNVRLSVIIPVRMIDEGRILWRFGFKRFDTEISHNIEFIVVDDGSSKDNAEKIKRECEKFNYKYLRINSEDKYFSLARARNFGAQLASGDYVLFEDIDFAPYIGFYNDIINEINIWDLDNRQEDFFTIPAIWLTEMASSEFVKDHSRNAKNKLLQKYLEFDTKYFEFGVPCGSVVLVSRHHYLSIGGQNSQFERWGFEDHEFANRLTSFSCKLPDPINKSKYVPTKYEEYITYEGFRARYRLYGDMVAAKGIMLFHISHPISSEFRNAKIRDENKKLFEESSSEFSKNNYYLGSLEDLTTDDRTLISSKNPFVYNNELWPLLGKVFFFDDGLHSPDEYLEFISDNKITSVLMQNPYKQESKLKIYLELKRKGIKCIVSERGALPGSIYFDETGFCCESKKYLPENWSRELNESEKTKIKTFIQDYQASGIALEKQGGIIGGQTLKAKLNISKNQNVLLVTFQTRNDATVKYFAGKIGSYDNFITLVQEVSRLLPKNWVMLYKNHPLEPEKVEIKNAICIDDYHINDALEISSMVLLMNSGCGILSLLYNVPVLHCSQAQYDNESFNRYINTAQEVINYCNKPFCIDQTARLQFLYYLVYEFYSYAENVYQKRKGKPDSWPVRLIFKTIRYPGKKAIYYFRDKSKAIWRKSIIFDRYRHYISTEYDILKKTKTTPASQLKTQPKKAKTVEEISPESKINIKHPIENCIIKRIVSPELYNKYKKNRDLYFQDSKSSIIKFYYKIAK